ncbi:outer membrane beta-barrel family protein [Aliifodinibius sp. S!AR15-10]|uniref:outer membrane beta-barrel family protein n=1 Tax=Aliifodinibius sp. S!AR15-10 TaxID=2950437 RepID=UPI0038F6D330
MVNDKLVRLPIDAVVQMLDGMSAANIEQIELITTPPAKYEAEGDAGLINIKMKEHGDLGYNGNIGGNLGYNSAETLGGNFNFSRRGRKMAYFINYSINYDNNKNRMFNRRSLLQDGFNELIRSDIQRDPITEVQNARLGMEYNINEKTTAGILLTGYRRKWDTKDLSDNFFRLGPDSTLLTEMNVRETNDWKNGMANISLDHSFNEHQSLNFDVDYLFYKHDNPSFFRNRFIDGNIDLMDNEAIDIEKETPINIWVGKINYRHQLSPTLNIETGIKGTLSGFNNDVQVSDKIQGIWKVNSSLTSEAELTEKIGALYLSSRWTPTNNLNINGGLRYEYADRLLSTPTEAAIVDRSDGYLFPSLFIKKELSQAYSIQASYTRRITRPTFNDLAPFVLIIDPKTFISGNSNLEPAISDGFKFDLQRNQWLVSLQYSFSNNEIAGYQPEIDPTTNEQTYHTQNLDYMRTYAVTTSIPLIPASWWEVQMNITGRYQRYRTSHLGNNVTLKETGFTANLTNTINLPIEFTFEISGFYESKSVWGIQIYRPRGSVDAGIQKRIGDGQGTIRLSMDDIFYTYRWESDMQIPEANLDSFFKYDFHLQQVKLTFTWNFGNNELRNVSVESGSAEEQGRVNTN